MKLHLMRLLEVVVVCLSVVVGIRAQEGQSQTAARPSVAPQAAGTIVPRLIKFTGSLLDGEGRPMTGPVGVTFALYGQQTGGAALWMETQNVKPDASGNYAVLLGEASANGIPEDLFASGEARWLGVQAERQPEQPRVLLVSVPYALKAGDAQTLGGLPASAFALSSSGAPTSGGVVVPLAATATSSSTTVPLVASTTPVTTAAGR